METNEHLPILKRIGGVLVIIGIIDIGVEKIRGNRFSLRPKGDRK